MALTRLSTLAAPTQITKPQLDAYFDLLTGAMGDQQIVFRGTTGHTSPAVSSGPSGSGGLVLQDSIGGAGNGGEILFGVGSANFFSIIKGGVEDGASNTRGHLDIGLRVNAADAALTQHTRFSSSGGVYIGATPSDPGTGSLSLSGALFAGTIKSASGTVVETLYASGGIYIGVNPVDPGAGFLAAGNTGSAVTVGLQIRNSLKNWLLRTGSDGSFSLYDNGAAKIYQQVTAALQMCFVTSQIYPPTDAGAAQVGCGLFAGIGAPNNANGNNGDIYFNASGGAATTMYQRRVGAWVGIV